MSWFSSHKRKRGKGTIIFWNVQIFLKSFLKICRIGNIMLLLALLILCLYGVVTQVFS